MQHVDLGPLGEDGAGPSTPTRHAPPSSFPTYGHSYFDDSEDEAYDHSAIDPELRLRTTRTAHSVIAESFRSDALKEKRKRRRLFSGLSMSRKGTRRVRGSLRRASGKSDDEHAVPGSPGASAAGHDDDAGRSELGDVEGETKAMPVEVDDGKAPAGKRRQVFVNMALPASLQTAGEPTVRYVRNKVRTSKYTVFTFVPKNLFEQFRRAANIYFLILVVLQVFSIFGATTPQIAMLPLVAILGMTAIKDAIEDWRRAKLDEEVNTSAATKLGGWKNVNQPTDPRTWLEKLFRLGPVPGKTSRGVRKLRETEARAGKQIVIDRKQAQADAQEEMVAPPPTHLDAPQMDFGMETIHSVAGSENASDAGDLRHRRYSMTSTAPSMRSKGTQGVIDWSRTGAGTAQWERTLWKKLEVGDLVLLRDNEQVPADIIVLSTSDPDSLCFVETKNLDGETNLKPRRALKATASISSEEDLEHATFYVDSEPPHANLYNYNGVLRYAGDKDEEKVEAITINELLLRGCTLRNTKWIIGMVVFTGGDTKIMLNGGDTPSKRSKIEKETNFNVIMNFIILVVLCLTTGLLHGYYRSLDNTSYTSYEEGSEASSNIYLDSLIIFVSSLIVFQNIVPISLYITIEIVKTIQAYFIFQDVEMYYEPYDTPCVPKTWNISDDLGQIEYVFSDKTGTLTQNVMEFKKCSIQGRVFGQGMTEAMLGAAKREGKQVEADDPEEMEEAKQDMVATMMRAFKNRYLQPDKLTLIAPDLAKTLADTSDPLRPHAVSFFRALAICHSVLSDKPEPEEQPFVIDYKAESPDEAALVAAARDVGFPFVARNTSRIDIEVLGATERWTPLRVLEFNSTRKRMSVIARDPNGRIVLFCKGADSVIYERLAPDNDEALKEATLKDLETFANGGLRTLCISYRNLGEDEFFNWARVYDAACAAQVDREAEIEKACEFIEHSLTILGATALEDKLQEGVPDAIAMLHKAGIKLWILTGDKLQTAIEIGYSCNLLTNDMEVMIISTDTEDGARAQIEAGLNKIASVLGPPPTKGARKIEGAAPQATFAVVIDGESLRYALQPSLKQLFLALGTQCAAVICCRVSPAQKAQTVKLVKEGCNAMTLSIGDGANDVAMIQEANVGVGLYGLEGSQAAMSADYAFGQFRFLTRLLFVHGRWSYVRVADMHANFFYKNVVWTLSMFWFFIYNSFDATYLYEYTFILLYNTLFTSLPVGILGAFEQDTNAVASMAFPQLYRRGVLGLDYTRKRFWLYMFDGLYQSVIIFFIPLLVYWDGTTWSSTGRDTNELYDLSSTMAAAGVFAANFYIGINSRYWTVINTVVISVSILLVFLWIPIYSALASFPYSDVVAVIYPTFNFWATVAITVFFAVGPRWIVSSARQSYAPRDKDIIREAWVAGDLKDQLGIAHRKRRKRPHAPSTTLIPDAEAFPAGATGAMTPTYATQASRFADDERGAYVPAALHSPQGARAARHSATPASDGARSPRQEPYTDVSPAPHSTATMPVPLRLPGRHERPTQDPAMVELDTLKPGPRHAYAAPSPSLAYVSPSALDGFEHDATNSLSPALVPPPRAPVFRHTSSTAPLIPLESSGSADAAAAAAEGDPFAWVARGPAKQLGAAPDFSAAGEGWDDQRPYRSAI
ncbi:phospholipid transporting ATPase [Cryptotrichosporon argae]